MNSSKNPVHIKEITAVKVLEGIQRKPLAFTADGNLNYFELEKGAKIPLHQHAEAQIGYVIAGKLRFFTESTEFLAHAGHSYAFKRNEKHGAEVLETAVVLDFFTPLRKDYLP